jgi:hypothetical protein
MGMLFSRLPTLSNRRLIAIPALLTLGVTLARLAGELTGGSAWFSREAGGAAALVGITWLVPVFGFWFGWRLTRGGQPAAHLGRAFLWPLAGVVAFVAAMAGVSLLTPGFLPQLAAICFFGLSAMGLAWRGWPRLAQVLIAYGLTARIPVVLVMLAATYYDWGTHYDVPPPDPGYPADLGWLGKWVLIGVLPQMTFWLAFTVAIGALFGAVGGLAARLRGSA